MNRFVTSITLRWYRPVGSALPVVSPVGAGNWFRFADGLDDGKLLTQGRDSDSGDHTDDTERYEYKDTLITSNGSLLLLITMITMKIDYFLFPSLIRLYTKM